MHEGFARQLAFFHLRQLEFPVTGQVGAGQLFHAQAAQQRHQLKRFGGGDQFAAIAQHVFFVQQTFDDGRACGGCAQAFFLHGFAQFIVFHLFARVFHRTQQGGLGVAGRGAGFQTLGLGLTHLGLFACIQFDQNLAGFFVLFFVHFFAINGLPTGLDQDTPCGFEVMGFARNCHLADAGGVHELCRRIEHGDEAAHHEVVEFLLGV